MKPRVLSATRVADPRAIALDEDLLVQARRAGISLTAMLEEINPSADDSDTDAFERQLIRFNIRTQADLERGIPASTIDEFWHPLRLDGSALEREDWGLADALGSNRFFASNQPQSWALFPEYINRIVRATPLADDVLASLVGVTTVINTNTYQAVYLQDNVINRRLLRTAEGTDFPTLFVKVGENTVYLEKYGAAIESTYEWTRRVQVPLFTIWLSRIAAQLRLDMAAQAADVLVNGDGNSNSATNYNVSTLDPSAPWGDGTAAGSGNSGADSVTVTDPYLQRIGDPNATSVIQRKLTYNAFLQWRTSLYALGMTHVVGRMNEILQILTLQMPTINPTMLLGLLQNGASYGIGTIQLPQSDLWGNLQIVYLPFAAGGLLIGLNRESALEMLVEQGSELTETDKNVRNQTNELVISQVSGFDRIISSACSTLTFA